MSDGVAYELAYATLLSRFAARESAAMIGGSGRSRCAPEQTAAYAALRRCLTSVPRGLSDIARDCGLSDTTTRRHLVAMRDAGQARRVTINRPGGGLIHLYALPEIDHG
jgi:predicted ArsR family transcriptional regulator